MILGLDLRKILEFPHLYHFYQNAAGVRKLMQFHARNNIKASLGDKILDIGCGVGNILDFLPEVDYTGFDLNSNYIRTAEKRYGYKAKFFCERIKCDSLSSNLTETFDIVLSNGVLHHLNDEEAIELFKLAKKVLKNGGKLVTFDGCYMNENQSRLERFLLSSDRGKFVRSCDEYTKLASEVFDKVSFSTGSNLLKIPYTFIFLECIK